MRCNYSNSNNSYYSTNTCNTQNQCGCNGPLVLDRNCTCNESNCDYPSNCGCPCNCVYGYVKPQAPPCNCCGCKKTQNNYSNNCYPQPPYTPPYNPPYTPTIPGGNSSFRELTTEDQAIFNKATANLTGVTYSPLLVSTQLVNGTNYTFIALATTVTATTPSSDYVSIKVYVSTSGEITLDAIKPIDY